MKSSLFVIAALIASVSSVNLNVGNDEDYVNLQIGVEAKARAHVREYLK